MTVIERQQSGGSRQKAWDKLRAKDYESVAELATEIGCTASGLRAYIAALEENKYVTRLADGSIRLTRWTGPRSPSFNVTTRAFRDWNLDQPMSAREFAELVDASGLTISQWCTQAGQPATHSTRVRQMMNGQRPVSPAYAQAAKHLSGPAKAGIERVQSPVSRPRNEGD